MRSGKHLRGTIRARGEFLSFIMLPPCFRRAFLRFPSNSHSRPRAHPPARAVRLKRRAILNRRHPHVRTRTSARPYARKYAKITSARLCLSGAVAPVNLLIRAGLVDAGRVILVLRDAFVKPSKLLYQLAYQQSVSLFYTGQFNVARYIYFTKYILFFNILSG